MSLFIFIAGIAFWIFADIGPLTHYQLGKSTMDEARKDHDSLTAIGTVFVCFWLVAQCVHLIEAWLLWLLS